MPFVKGRNKTGGRKPGSVNTLTKTVRETVLHVFNELQSDPKVKLEAWAKKNPKDFYLIASKLIPAEIVATGNTTIKVKVVYE